MDYSTRIKVLPEPLQNKIAAGEVVERPASVVKELLENSLDAEASDIRISLGRAGKSEITVMDNGCGMSAEDARLSCQRFSTSKLSEESDLLSLHTFGFRGEALAAISSVSRFTLTTATDGAESGLRISITGGVMDAEKPAPPHPGTTVSVRDLFFNTPARLKFLKSDQTELWHCLDVVTNIAISRPQVSLSLMSNGRLQLNLPASASRRERIIDLFGADFSEHLAEVSGREDTPLSVKGFVSIRDHHATRRQQYLFLNGRAIRDPSLAQAVYRATDNWRPRGRHPVFMLFIETPGDTVDVNVHPAKREVRFSQPGSIRGALERALVPLRRNPVSMPPLTTARQENGREGSGAYKPPEASRAWTAQEPLSFKEPSPVSGVEDGASWKARPSREYLAFGKTFFAFAEMDGITVVDQHAAHERILFEKFLKRSSTPLPLLIPEKVALATDEFEMICSNLSALKELGIEAEPFGGTSLLVRTVPSEMEGRDIRTLIRDLAGFLAERGAVPKEVLKHDAAALMACHDAVRGGDDLSDEDRTNLLALLDDCEDPSSCPHGRPTRVHVSGAEFLKRFKRI